MNRRMAHPLAHRDSDMSTAFQASSSLGRSLSSFTRRRSSKEAMSTGRAAQSPVQRPSSDASSSCSHATSCGSGSMEAYPQAGHHEPIVTENTTAGAEPKLFRSLRRSLSFGRRSPTGEDKENKEPTSSAASWAAQQGRVMVRASKWSPLYMPCSDVPKDVLAVKNVNPSRLQCKVYCTLGPNGCVRWYDLVQCSLIVLHSVRWGPPCSRPMQT